MRIKHAAVILAVLALVSGSAGCRAMERYLNEREAFLASMPLTCYESFGSYSFDPGWVEDGSGNSHLHSYCLAEDLDDPDRPYSVTVSSGTNGDSQDDLYSAITEEYGEEAVTVTGNGSFDDNAFASFEIRTGDSIIYRWYQMNDSEYVLFELTADDENYAQQNGLSEAVYSAFSTFQFER